MNLRLLLFCCFCAGIVNGQDLVVKIKENGIVKTTKNYCDNYQAGCFFTLETLSNIKDKKNLDKATKAFIKSTNTVEELSVLCGYIVELDLEVSEKFEIIKSLSLLFDKMLCSNEIGVGNIELSSVISQFVSGLFFSIYNNASKEEREEILSYILDFGYFDSKKYSEKILNCEELCFLFNIKKQDNILDLILEIINYNSLENMDVSPGQFLYQKLVEKDVHNFKLVHQLQIFNKYSFASSVIQSYRSVLMCQMPKYVREVILTNLLTVEKKNQMLSDICEHKLSHDSLGILYFYYSGNNIEKAYRTRDEVRTCIFGKGSVFISPVLRKIGN